MGTTPRVPTLPRAEVPLRHCRRCEIDQPAWSFVLADDEDAKVTARGVRLWCGFCLIGRGHIRRAQLDKAYATHAAAERRAQVEAVRAAAMDTIARATACIPPALDLTEGASVVTGDRYEPVVLTDQQRRKAVDRAREHAAAIALFDAAQDDPVLARAMRRALDMRATAREEGAA